MRPGVPGGLTGPPVRVVEVLAALSLATDLASGLPFEKGLRTCLVATAFADVLALGADEREAVFHAALLRAVGCTAVAPENAALFGDDTAFQAALKRLDPGDPAVFAGQLAAFGDWGGARQAALARRFVDVAATEGPRAARAGCEVSRALGPRLGLPAAAVTALDDVYERWYGLGIPAGHRGEQVSAVARVVHVAEQAVLAHARGGRAAAIAEVTRRAGGHLDPDLATRFTAEAETVLAPLDAPDLLTAVTVAAPGTAVDAEGVEELARSVAIVADLKGRHLVGARRRHRRRGLRRPSRTAALRPARGSAPARPGPGRRTEQRVGPAGPARRG